MCLFVPKGAAEIFNHKGRIAWWVGPPFGGGEWHSECKGDAAQLNDVLKLFAKIEGPKKRLVVLDGLGYSFWLDPNGTKRGDRNTKIDWSFSVWQTDRWKMQKDLLILFIWEHGSVNYFLPLVFLMNA